MKSIYQSNQPLSTREHEVLELITYEYSTKEIAQKLYVSFETAKTHRKNLMEKLGVKNAAGLVREGFHQGLLSIPSLAGILLLCFCTLSGFAQTTWYVKSGGAGTQDGTSWQHAMANLQSAIDATVGGDQIWIASGTYYPTDSFDLNGNNSIEHRERAFYVTQNIQLYGGFQGTESQLDQRDWKANPVIFNGDFQQDHIQNNNAYHVLFIDGTTPHGNIDHNCVIDGIEITNGYADGSASILTSNSSGAGATLLGRDGNICSPMISHCSFYDNEATGFGGAILSHAVSGESSPIISRCEFNSNTASRGGAIYNWGEDGTSSPLIDHCTFTDHQGGEGGVINNTARNGVSSPVIEACSFYDNTSNVYGGAIYNLTDDGNCLPKIVNCLFIRNSAPGGGAVVNFEYGGNCSPQIINCSFYDNSASLGGAVASSGDAGIGTIQVNNCIFWANGDELFDDQSNTQVTNCLIDDGSINGTVNLPSGIVNGGNNIDANPLFVDAGSDNLRLSKTSPAIDQGNNSFVLSISQDLDGQPRINQTVDIGAYENPYSYPCLAQIVIDNIYGPIDGLYQSDQPLILGEGAVIGTGADVLIVAPQIDFKNDVDVETGAVLEIITGYCGG